MKILITNAFGPQNRGDHELLESLMSILRAHSVSADSIEVFTTYPDESRAAFSDSIIFHRSPFYRPTSILAAFEAAWDLTFWLASSYFPIFRKLLSPERRARYDSILKADLIIMCPGGYLYSNKLSLYANIVNIFPLKQARGHKVAAPMSIGPFSNWFDKLLTKNGLSALNTIHTRESYSTRLVQSLRLKPIQTPDLAWWTTSDSEAENEDLSWKDHYVGTVIDWNFPLSENPEALRARYENEIIAACRILSSATNGRPVILYNQVGSGAGLSADEKLIKRIVDRSNGAVTFDPTAVTPSVLRRRLKHCEGIIASRFHSALFAIQARAPFISIAYQPKAEFILKDLGLSNHYRLIEDFSGTEAANSLLLLSKNRTTLGARLAECQINARNQIELNFGKELSQVSQMHPEDLTYVRNSSDV